MTLEQLLSDYGYLALVVGCFLEGETILVLAGFAAHRGYLDLRLTMLAAFAGSVLGDQLYFFLGRRYGPRLLARRPGWQRAAQAVDRRLQRHRDLFVLGFRFLYGLRTVSPFVIAIGGVSLLRFTVLNVIGAAVWAVAFAGAGYLFGESVRLLLGRVERYELVLFLGLAGAGLAVFVWRTWRARRPRPPAPN
ncbi:MAG: DedA family protein [Planctomycetes bacterium]|nr:DedA family protein [Planctomycetota bacterium]